LGSKGYTLEFFQNKPIFSGAFDWLSEIVGNSGNSTSGDADYETFISLVDGC
jgi:hypothetical protein